MGDLFTKQRRAWNCSWKVSFETMRKLPSQGDDVEEWDAFPVIWNYTPPPGSTPQGIAQRTHILLASADVFVWELSKWNPFVMMIANMDEKTGFIWTILTLICQYTQHSQTHVPESQLYINPSIYQSIYINLCILHLCLCLCMHHHVNIFAVGCTSRLS